MNNPTRIDSGNILDLILTSNPSIIVNTHTTPGMSDHEAVTFNVNLNPVRNRKPPHKIFQYKSANWDKLKDDINQLTTTYFHRNPNSRDINENWNFFRNNLTSLVDRNIPSRNTKAKAHLPWITREIIRMQRKRNKSHKKAKQTGRNSDWEKFMQIRRQASKAAAKSYSDYLNNHIGESLQLHWRNGSANYRPISLTCILCKAMEHIILSNMSKHLHKHNILLHFQHGFLSGLSCESQLIETVHDWITAMDNKSQIDAILLDFTKAFDKVPHKRLLSKLGFYGITGNTKNWIKSFLSHQKQRVSVNGALSDNTCVTSGVPQGSVLGPVIFLLYINDINNNIQSPIRLC